MMKGDRYTALDVLRGLAALSVVFSHWPHFFYSPRHGLSGPYWVMSDLPLHNLFWPLYRYGPLAVDMFFLLSGAVFFFMYADAVYERRVSAGQFFILRFSRLYPLHFVTLLLVLVLQFIYFQQHATYFVYLNNDLKHFLLQLFFVSNWPPSHFYSFNGPIWSVSIEVLLYATFFMMCRWGLRTPPFLVLMSLLGSLLSVYLSRDWVGRGLFAFFLGGQCFYFAQAMMAQQRRRAALLVLSMGLTVAGSLFIAVARHKVGLTVRNDSLLQWALVAIVFPMIMIGLMLGERRLRKVTKRLAWVGEISYSSYLLHFPMQLFLVVAMYQFGLAIDYSSPWTLAIFMGTVIMLALLSFRAFEHPMQNFIRRALIEDGRGAQAVLSKPHRITPSSGQG